MSTNSNGWIAGFIGALLLVLGALPGAALAQTVTYVHTDALGSIVAETDAGGAVVSRREYEPYGLQLTPEVQDGPGYTGHVQDAATGLTYMQQRYYDPGVGRFLSVDPVTAYDSKDWRFLAAMPTPSTIRTSSPTRTDVVRYALRSSSSFWR